MKYISRLVVACVLSPLLPCSTASQAAVINVSVSGGSSNTEITQFLSPGGTVLDIDIQTAYDELAPPIWKTFITDGSAGQITLTETITNTGTVAWTDWDEMAINLTPAGGPGLTWETWTPDPAQPGAFGKPDSVANPLGMPGNGEFLSYLFDSALQSGASVSLTKTLSYAAGISAFSIVQYPSVPASMPVPIPEALPLAAFSLGLLGLIGVRRRKTNY